MSSQGTAVWLWPLKARVRWTFRHKTWRTAPAASPTVQLNRGTTSCPSASPSSTFQVSGETPERRKRGSDQVLHQHSMTVTTGSPFTVRVTGEGRIRESISRRQRAASLASVGSVCDLNLKIPGTHGHTHIRRILRGTWTLHHFLFPVSVSSFPHPRRFHTDSFSTRAHLSSGVTTQVCTKTRTLVGFKVTPK